MEHKQCVCVAIESLDDGVEVKGGHAAHVEGEGFEEKLG